MQNGVNKNERKRATNLRRNRMNCTNNKKHESKKKRCIRKKKWRNGDEGKLGAQRREYALTHIRANRVNLGQ